MPLNQEPINGLLTEPSKSSVVIWNFGLMYPTFFRTFAKLFSNETLQSIITKLLWWHLEHFCAIVHVSIFLLRSRRGWEATSNELIHPGCPEKLATRAICNYQRLMSPCWGVRILRWIIEASIPSTTKLANYNYCPRSMSKGILTETQWVENWQKIIGFKFGTKSF